METAAMQTHRRGIDLKPKLSSGVSRKFESAGWRRELDILRQSKNLETASERFRVHQRAERGLRFFLGDKFGKGRDDAGQKVVLVGETRDLQSICFSGQTDVRPVNMHGNIPRFRFLPMPNRAVDDGIALESLHEIRFQRIRNQSPARARAGTFWQAMPSHSSCD